MALTDYIPLVGDVVDYFSAQDANKANKKIAREQMAFQKHMSDTAITRRVRDLKRAGLNPMLAYSDGASSPAGASATIQPATRNSAQSIRDTITSSLQRQNIEASSDLLRAQERKTLAEAAVVESSVPYSSQSAALNVQELSQRVKQLAAQAENLMVDTEGKQFNVEKMQPLAERAAELHNQALKLGLSEKEADAKFFEAFEDYPRIAQFVMGIIRAFNRR